MEYQSYNHQNVLHCFYCGGSFFEENGINRITLANAKALSLDKRFSISSKRVKSCPKDNSPLAPIKDDQAVPPYINLFRCPLCQGIFAHPDDLVKFKKAQEAKIAFFKTWQRPIPAIKSVLVLGSLAIVLLSIVATKLTLQQKQKTQIQAQQVVQNLTISKTNKTLLLYFKTPKPLKSEVIFKNPATGETTTMVISNQPTTKHHLITNQLNLNTPLQYRIILYSPEGKIIEGPERNLE